MFETDAMYIIDENMRIVYANQAFRRYYPTAALGEICHCALAQNDHICGDCPLTGQTGESAFVHAATGEWLRATAVKMEWEKQKIYHAISVKPVPPPHGVADASFYDHCKGMLDTLLDGKTETCILGQYCRSGFPIFYANAAFLQMMGYDSYEELIAHRGDSVLQHIHPDDVERVERCIMGDPFRNGMNYDIVYRMQRKDGSYLTVADRGFITEEEGCQIVISRLSDMSGMLRRQKTMELENKALHQQNRELQYMKSRRLGAYHCCIDEEGFPFKEIGQQFCDMLGYSKDEIETQFGNCLEQLVVPEDRDKLKAVYSMAEIGSAMDIQYRIVTKHRSVIWVKGNVRLSEFDGRRFYQATIIEITDEIRSQQQLKQRNHELELMLSAIPGGLKHIEADEEYTYRFLSEEAAALFGYTVEELMAVSGGKAMRMVYHEDLEYVRAQMEQCLSSGGTEYSVRHRVQCKDGSLKYILSCGRIVQNEGETPYFRSLYIDITREKENEDTIAQLQLIRALSNDYSDVYMVDLSTNSLSPVVQQKAERMMPQSGNSYDSWLTALSEDAIYPEDREGLLRRLSTSGIRERLKDREMFHHDFRQQRNGQISHWQIKCVRLGENDAPLKAIIGFRNIDEEVRYEEKRNQALQNALKQAQYASKAKTTFLNNMSHDIRTPMNAIIVCTELAAAHIDHKDRALEYLNKISQASSHLLALINDVLDMSRIEAGKLTLSEKQENLSEIICEIRNIMQADVYAKQLKFDMNVFDVVDEWVWCDKLRVNQILLNLLSNAVKFTPTGGTVSVAVRQKPTEYSNHCIYEFRIRDTGIGMEQSFLDHIFEPFAQERPSTLSGITGTGLGMAITKNIVDMCGGTIAVTSCVGKGTEITVELPLRPADEHREIECIAQLEGMRALVVDDDMSACQSISKLLRRLGMRVDWTVGGKEAVVRAKEAIEMKDAYRMYLVDWLMPDMNGIETARQLRKITGEETPIVLLSAYDYAEIEAEAKEAGIQDFVTKPLFLSDIRSLLKRLCNAEKETSATPQNSALKGKRVLVVEDTLLNQEISVDILELVGIHADVAENGQVALDMLQSKDSNYYSLVFMDIQMPVMDGYEAARRIRKLEDPVLAGIPIVAMTADAYDEDRKQAFAAGMDEHITKPLDVAQLFRTIETLAAHMPSATQGEKEG